MTGFGPVDGGSIPPGLVNKIHQINLFPAHSRPDFAIDELICQSQNARPPKKKNLIVKILEKYLAKIHHSNF